MQNQIVEVVDQQLDRLLSPRTVYRLLGVSQMTVHRLRVHGRFPAPVQVSARRIAWRESEINAYLEARTLRNEARAA